MKKKVITITICIFMLATLSYSTVAITENNVDFNNDFYLPMPIPLIPEQVDSGDMLKTQSLLDIPSEFSWADIDGVDWTTPAKNQGDCGSCWIFAALGAFESVIKIVQNEPDINPDLSEQYVLSCLPAAANNYAEGCLGGSPYNAFKYLKDDSEEGNYFNGAILESCMPYQQNDDVPCQDKCDDWLEGIIPLFGYGQRYPGFDDENSRTAIKERIYNHGPVAAGIDCTNHFIQWGQSHHDPEEYYPFDEGQEWYNRLNHMIVIVGWKDDPSVPNGGYWICKNSWGQNWGYDGFYNAEYGSMFTGYGIYWVEYEYDENNTSPTKPDIINAPTSGKIDQEYQFSVQTSDVNENDICYRFDWGDDSYSEWSKPLPTGIICNITHTWSKKGDYTIRAIAKDEHGGLSEWSEPIQISLPKNKTSSIIQHWLSQYELILNLINSVVEGGVH